MFRQLRIGDVLDSNVMNGDFSEGVIDREHGKIGEYLKRGQGDGTGSIDHFGSD